MAINLKHTGSVSGEPRGTSNAKHARTETSQFRRLSGCPGESAFCQRTAHLLFSHVGHYKMVKAWTFCFAVHMLPALVERRWSEAHCSLVLF